MTDGIASHARFVLDVVHANGARQEIVLEAQLELGRTAELRLDDDEASRRHSRLTPYGDGVVVEDLGSTNGTFLNEQRIASPTVAGIGDVVRIGRTTVRVAARLGENPPIEPALTDFEVTYARAGTVWCRPGSYAARYAERVAAALDAAARALDPLRRIGADVRPSVYLVDPFPDPNDPGRLVTAGTVVDAEQGEIWMAVTPESLPEALERPLALLYTRNLAAAADLAPIIEGYALHRAGKPFDDAVLRADPMLPPLFYVQDERRPVMAQAFVAFLVEEYGDDKVLELLQRAAPGTIDSMTVEILGAPLGLLEMRWLGSMWGTKPSSSVRGFLVRAKTYFMPYRSLMAAMFGFSLLTMTFTVLYTKVIQHLFNDVLTIDFRTGESTGTFGDAIPYLLLLGGGLVVGLVGHLGKESVGARLGSSIVRDVRERMFNRVQELPIGWHQSREQGDTMSRFLSDVQTFEMGTSSIIREGPIQFVTLLVNAILLLQLNVMLAVVTLLIAPTTVLVYRAMVKEAQRRSLQVEERQGAVSTVLAENLDAQPTVKAFNLENREIGRFRAVSARLARADVRLGFFVGLFNVSMNLVVQFLQIGILALGAWLVTRGDLQIGTFIAFNALVNQVINPMTQLADLGRAAQMATGALHRIEEIIEEVPAIVDAPGAQPIAITRGDIRFDGVTFAYGWDRAALEDVDLVIPAGRRVAIVGPSGSGKSTLLSLVQRTWDPSFGTVSIDGTDLRDVTMESLRASLGVVQQDTFLFNGSIRDNIALARPGATEDEILAAAQAAGLGELLTLAPRGLDTPVGERGSMLSGGQRQRVAIARVLLRQPAILLLDEATSALDPVTERGVMDALARVSAGRTTVSVPHRLHTVQDYDLIVVLHEGRLVEQGRHEELLARGGVYAHLWSDQHELTGAEAPGHQLRRLPLFDNVSDEVVAGIEALGRRVELQPGDRRREGGWLGIVLEGNGQIETPAGEGWVVTGTLGAGTLFGVRALLGDDRGSFLVPTGRMVLVELDRQALEQLGPALAQLFVADTGGPHAGIRLTRESTPGRRSALASPVYAAPPPPAPPALL
jgi:ABC-type multidrug transport system fused ATPase/permease subunit